jgi:tetratricopeptide (TPR) repeat protein
MPRGQSFVGRPLSKWDIWRTLCLLAVFLLVSCTSPLEKAQKEYALAELMVRENNLPAARMAVTRALGHRDDQLEILELDASIKFRMGDLAAAYEAYRVVLAIDPNNETALTGVAQLGLSTGNLRESRSAIETALAINPRNLSVILSKGVHALVRKNYDEAVTLGERLNEIREGDPRGVVLRARGMFLRGEREAAMKLLYDSATENGNNRLIASALMENARAQPDVTIMLEQLAFLRGDRPDSADLSIDAINILYKSGQQDRARSEAADFLDRFGENQIAISRLAGLWKEYDSDPLTSSMKARLARSGGEDARLISAEYYFDQGDLDTAKSLVETMNTAEVLGLFARIGVRKNEGGSVNMAQSVIETDTTNCNGLAAIAEARLEQGKPNDAIRAAQVIATNCLDRTDGHHLLVEAYTAAGRTAGVERVYRDGIDAHPLDRELPAEFAQWLLSQGRPSAALSAARRFTKAAPSRASTWQLYREICIAVGNSACAEEASKEEARARQDYSLDILPGQRPRNPLTGQSWR